MNLEVGEKNHMRVLDSSKANASQYIFYQQISLNASYAPGIVLRAGETALNSAGSLPTVRKLTY